MKSLFYYAFVLQILLLFGCTSSENKTEMTNSDITNVAEGNELITEEGLQLNKIILPQGFKIAVYGRVDNARSLVLTPNNTLFVSNRGGGNVYAVQDTDGDFKIDKKYIIAKDLNMPNGIAFRNGSLYVAEINKLTRYDNIEQNLANPPKPITIYDDYPTDSHHGWKYIAFGPDDKLYVPVGAPCNICESKNEIYASITRMNPDGSNREIMAKGVRNTVGFTWHPETKELWFTDNGRDMLGDDIPPCELNKVTKIGDHFGYPYWHGGTIKDPEFGHKYPKENFIVPAQNLGPHVAPLGVKFYTGNMFPAEYKNKIFIAEHGSWNRSNDAGHTGYKVTMVTEENGKGTNYEVFIEGFLDKATNTAWGRPVDLVIMPDGSMLLSDDMSGTIYRISHTKP